MYLVFDTETTGKPANYKAPMTDLNNWPRVIELGFQIYNSNGLLVHERCDLIKPDGWVIPTEKFWIDNGFSTAINEAKGVPMLEVLDEFVKAARMCTVLVAHNLTFDYNIVGAEMIRYNQRVGKKMQQACTMELGTNLCKLPGSRGGYNWPQLPELHQFLFQEGFDGAHSALADVQACARCFFELKRRGITNL